MIAEKFTEVLSGLGRRIYDWFFGDPRYVRDRVGGLMAILVVVGLIVWLAVALTARLGKDELWFRPVGTREEEDPRPWPDFSMKYLPEIQRALKHTRAGNTLEARKILDSLEPALMRESEHAELATALCEILVREGRLEEALTMADFALATEANPLRYFWRGNVLRMLGRYDRAAEDFRMALERIPASPLFNNAVLLLEVERGNSGAVAEDLRTREAVGLEHTRPSWAFAAAALELERGNPQTAAVYLRSGVPALPPHEAAWLLDFKALKKHQNEPAVMAFFFQTSDERWRPRALTPPTRSGGAHSGAGGARLPRLSADEELLLLRPATPAQTPR